ncbi:glycosyltransferase [Deefgea piscis]|uniref:Glycosyltransferase n=1 Tax=Deefgea piscis TaxID=2739061 RepID=A0A6M8SRH9_9NEIS|nr:rhamnan synthesis F family protein [Deefgea piscis]QKJ67892.1 glycosyltransferase [Deefgea piscis]
MNNKLAVFYCLWGKNTSFLKTYLERNRRVIIIPDYSYSEELRDLVVAHGSELLVLPFSNSGCEDVVIKKQVDNAIDLIVGYQFPAMNLSSSLGGETENQIIKKIIERDFGLLYSWFEKMDNWLAGYDLEIILLNEDVLCNSKILALWARSKSIPVLQLVHGTGIGRDYIFEEYASDFFAVYGQRSAEYYLDVGIDEANIILVGNPAWDDNSNMIKNKVEFKKYFYSKHSIDISKPIVLFATTWNANLSFLDDRDFVKQIEMFFNSISSYFGARSQSFCLVIKDRLIGEDFSVKQNIINQMAKKYDVHSDIIYDVGDARSLVSISDLVVSFDSNISIEAVLLEVPAINVLTEFGCVAGGGFGANDGVLCASWHELASTIDQLLSNDNLRSLIVENANKKKDYFNYKDDGQAAVRLVDLIQEKSRRYASTKNEFLWRKCLDIEHIDSTVYHEGARADVIAMFNSEPSHVLDIGCAAGGNGALLKSHFHGAKVWGIEVNEAAAEIAKEKLDHVFVGKFEDIDFLAGGVSYNFFDAVILADVLEHTYNPWKIMVDLKPYLKPNAQIIISIPNVRNLWLMDSLAAGRWKYEEAGLLDITHIRFFAKKDFEQLIFETGYEISHMKFAIDQRLQDVLALNSDKENTDLEFGKIKISNLNREDVYELCSLQFYYNLNPSYLGNDSDASCVNTVNNGLINGPKIAIVLHLFYLDQWRFFCNQFKALQFSFDLFITTTIKLKSVVVDLIKMDFPFANVYAFDNRGRDFSPLVQLIQLVDFNNYDFVCKLHTKKSPHLDADFVDDWRNEILRGIIPVRNEIFNIFSIFDKFPDVGVISSQGTLVFADAYIHNRAYLEKLSLRLGFEFSELKYEYPAGSMFWCRGIVLDSFKNLNINIEDFEIEQGQLDGTLAHALERLVPLVAFKSGLITVDSGYQGAIKNPRYVVEKDNYLKWKEKRVLSASNALWYENELMNKAHAMFSICIIDRNSDLKLVIATIKSITQQLYRNVNILVISPLNNPQPSSDIQWLQVNSNFYSSIFSVQGLILADWAVFVDAGDLLSINGLLLTSAYIESNKSLLGVYTDDDFLDIQGLAVNPRFKPNFNIDMMRSFPYADGCLFIRNCQEVKVILQSDVVDSAEQVDILLKLYDFYGANSIGHVPELVCSINLPQTQKNISELKYKSFVLAVESHLNRNNIIHSLSEGLIEGSLRVNYLHAACPLVSIIIPTKNQLVLLKRCVESVLEKTQYANYEIIIVDNQSDEADALAYLQGLESLGSTKIRVIRYSKPFNFSAINNEAVKHSNGEYLVLLNNDTMVIQGDWLSALLNHAQRNDVGVVGAKLLYPNGSIQHAGVVLGLRGPADHPLIGASPQSTGYMHRLQLDQNYSVVTAACLMIRKSTYIRVGGMDEEAFKVSYNDVDLCLKVGQLGLLVVWTPYSVLIHEGSVSQATVDATKHAEKLLRFQSEQKQMYSRWFKQIGNDPSYNKNLTLSGNGFELEERPLLSWNPVSWVVAPKILCHPADQMGCGNYRLIQPFFALESALKITGGLTFELLPAFELAKFNPDVMVFQRQITDQQIEFMNLARNCNPSFKIYELDDYLPNLPMKSAHRDQMPKDILRTLRKALTMVDRFVVSTDELAVAYSGLHSNIHVVRNYLSPNIWGGVSSSRRCSEKPRVGWAGGVSHTGDLELIAGVVKELANEVEWVFFGMCPDKLKPYVHEFHTGVPIDQYPAKLASLNLDLALAPLELNLFNRCKSNLRLLEYGICGYPVICTDIEPYAGNLPVVRVKNKHKDWVDAIRACCKDLDSTAKAGDALKRAVQSDWMLQDGNLDLWLKAWTPT